MIGLILLYFIGRRFYELAFEYDKHQWLFAILGIASYYAGTFITGVIIGAIAVAFDKPELLELDPIVLGLMAVPGGLLLCWGFYVLLKKSWDKSKSKLDPEVLDGEMMR
jgi:hypothetical protein